MKAIKNTVFNWLFPSSNSFFTKKVMDLSYRLRELKWDERLTEAGVLEAKQIFTYTSCRELRELYELAVSCPPSAVVLEIGSHLGASSCYIAAGLKKVNGHLFCVDTWQNQTMPEGQQDTFKIFQKNTRALSPWITPIVKKSNKLDRSDVKTPLSLVFIDGDHSYTAVKQDFECVRDWLGEEGVIAFHDFGNSHFEGVTRVVGEAIASGEWMIAGQVETLVWLKRSNWLTPCWLTEERTVAHSRSRDSNSACLEEGI